MRNLFAIAAIALVAPPALAGDNSCFGKIVVGKKWTTITSGLDQSDPHNARDCRFKTDSRIGRRILATCPDGSMCFVDNDLSNSTTPITKMPSGIEKQ